MQLIYLAVMADDFEFNDSVAQAYLAAGRKILDFHPELGICRILTADQEELLALPEVLAISQESMLRATEEE